MMFPMLIYLPHGKRSMSKQCERQNKDEIMINLELSTHVERELINDKLVHFNLKNVPFNQKEAFIDLSFSIKDDAGEIIGGINSVLYCWHVLYVDILFVDESHRGKGYGKLLLQQAENAARQQGGYMVHLDTFDWQAKSFYVNAGYEVFGQLENCPPGHTRFYMKKILNP
jgi:GNAT superfamily N-acetyltransferase